MKSVTFAIATLAAEAALAANAPPYAKQDCEPATQSAAVFHSNLHYERSQRRIWSTQMTV